MPAASNQGKEQRVEKTWMIAAGAKISKNRHEKLSFVLVTEHFLTPAFGHAGMSRR